MDKSRFYITVIGAVVWSFVYFSFKDGFKSSLKTLKPPMMPMSIKPKVSPSHMSRRGQQENKYTAEYSVSNEQRVRQNILKKACTRLKMNNLLPTNDDEFIKMVRKSTLYFSDKFKFVACLIPKVGCTNFKRVMLVEHGLTNVTEPRKISGNVATNFANEHFRLDSLNNATRIQSRLKNYYKFVMVREPLNRVLSAFRNKIEKKSPSALYRSLAKKIYAHFNNDTTEMSDCRPNFKQFLQYIKLDSERQDNHWKNYYKLCLPCSIEYELIAKLETVDDDMNYVMDRIGMKKVTYPGGYQYPTNDERVKKYYQEIPAKLLREVHAIYKKDYELFGYSLPDIPKT